jgi:hypothetical protein
MPSLRGIEHPAHKLTPEAVREIRRAYRPGWISYRDIAEHHDVSLQLIAQVIKRKAWGWVEDDDDNNRTNDGSPWGSLFYAPSQDKP